MRAGVTQVLLIGNAESPEMRPAIEAVKRLAPAAEIRSVESFTGASSGDLQPDLVVVCQHWPDEFPPAEVGRLFRECPLARFVVCYGPWCASDGRTRAIWPLAVRVPANEADDRLRLELDVLGGERAPLPLTASRDEVFVFDALCSAPPCQRMT
jgi:hypothetical protein